MTRPRNMDFIDRFLELERKMRRINRVATVGPWTDLSPYLTAAWVGQLATPVARRNGVIVEMAGAVLAASDSTVVLFDSLPAELCPAGGDFGGTFGVSDIYLPIDTDNFGTYVPVGGGWSADVTGDTGLGSTDFQVRFDPAIALMHTTTRALSAPAVGNNNGLPMDGTALILNGISYLADGDVVA